MANPTPSSTSRRDPKPIIKKKISMLGTFAVGKTSLVRRFVSGIYSEDYLTTMGAKVEKKSIVLEDQPVDLMVWDLNGEDRFQALQLDYVEGSAGYLLVVDKSRRSSLEAAHALHQKVRLALGPVPFILVVNKSDLPDAWDEQDRELRQLEEQGWPIRHTSAKTGTGVDAVFETLARTILER